MKDQKNIHPHNKKVSKQKEGGVKTKGKVQKETYGFLYRTSKSANLQNSDPPFGKGRRTTIGIFFCSNSANAIK